MVVFKNVKKEEIVRLKKLGLTAAAPKTAHETIRYIGKGVTAVLYESGRLFLQGKEEDVERITGKLKGIGEEVKKESFRSEKGWMIGSDEALKGDTFGGIVIAGVRADDAVREKLRELGVKDSKSLSDREVLRLAEEVRKVVECEVYSVLPEEYNKIIELGKSVTDLLNEYHSKIGKELGNGRQVVDKYPGCKAGDLVTEKAEQKYVEVAAASILARASALQQLDYLSMEAGFRVPKGSTHVGLALDSLKVRQKDFSKFVKMHFRNVKEFLEKKREIFYK
jgi:ribonuclease HIII